MMKFKLLDEQSAPAAARPILEKTRQEFKMIPNLERTMALAPALLESYSRTWTLFAETSLSAVEQQIVYQTVNFENECNYCVPWHTLLCQQAGMAEDEIEALRNGTSLPDPRHEQLRRFTRALVRSNGRVAESDMDAFSEAGYTPRHALEVVLGIAIKTMSNYTNAIAGTELDPVVEKYRWQKPATDQE